MNNKLKILGIIALVIGVVFSVVISLGKSNSVIQLAGITNYDELQADRIIANATSTIGGLTGGIASAIQKVSFASATTTICAASNPFAATSTLDLAIIRFTTAGATTTVFDVGTTTPAGAAGGVARLDLASLIRGAGIATNTLPYVINGSSAANYVVGAVNNARIEVAPLESVVVYATSTADILYSPNLLGGPAGTCTFRFLQR